MHKHTRSFYYKYMACANIQEAVTISTWNAQTYKKLLRWVHDMYKHTRSFYYKYMTCTNIQEAFTIGAWLIQSSKKRIIDIWHKQAYKKRFIISKPGKSIQEATRNAHLITKSYCYAWVLVGPPHKQVWLHDPLR